jgi:hypothetical protein
MSVDPIEIKDFISQLLDQIEQGSNIEERHINGAIEIEVSIENVIQKEGGLKVYVAHGEAGTKTGQIAKVKFSVYPRQSEKSKHEDYVGAVNTNSDDDSIY